MALTTAQIQQAYVTFFSRPADVAGLNYWSSYTGSIANLYATFAQSAEYAAAFNNLSNGAKVNLVYQNLFGRPAEAEGLNYWTLQLDQGAVTVANLALALSAGAQGSDATTVANRVVAATAFTNELDTAAEILAYSGATANAAAKAWLAGVTTDASLAAAIAPATLTASVASVTTVGSVVPGQTFTLTTGTDNIVGTSGNDSITDDAADLTKLDTIDLAGGVDTITLNNAAGTINLPTAITVSNVENLVLRSGANAVTADVQKWTGLQSVTVEELATADVNVDTKGNVTSITVTGGDTVTLVDNATTHTLATVTADGFNTAVDITSDKLTALNLANNTANANVTVTATAGTRALALALEDTANVGVNDATATSVTVTSTGDNTTARLDFAAAKALTLSGAGDLKFVETDLDKVTTVTLNGSGAVEGDLSGAALLTSVVATASTGKNTITLDGTQTTYTGGAGQDIVLLGAAPTKAINGGSGTTDIVGLADIADLTTLDAAAFANITNFEALRLTGDDVGGNDGNLDLADLPASIAAIEIDSTNVGANISIANAAAVQTLNILDAFSSTVGNIDISVAVDATLTADTLNIGLGDGTNTTLVNAAANTGTVTAAAYKTVAITTQGDQDTLDTAQFANTLNLVVADATKITATGNAGLDLTGSTLTKVATVAAAGVEGDVTVTLTVTTGSTVTTGAGDDTIVTAGAATKVDTINAGDGDNNVTTDAGNDVVTVGKGDSVIDVKAGNNTVTAGESVSGNAAATIDAGDGNNTITAGAGGWAVTVGDGKNTITTGAGDDVITVGNNVNAINISAGGDDTIVFSSASQSSGVFSTITGINAGDTLDLNAFAAVKVGGVATAGTALGDKVTVGLEDYQTYIAQAASSTTAGDTAWFNFGGNTYIVVTDDTDGIFTNGVDTVIKLAGVVDLSTAELGGSNTIVIA